MAVHVTQTSWLLREYRFFIENATVVLQNLYNTAQHFKTERRRNVVHGGENKEQAVLKLRDAMHLQKT